MSAQLAGRGRVVEVAARERGLAPAVALQQLGLARVRAAVHFVRVAEAAQARLQPIELCRGRRARRPGR